MNGIDGDNFWLVSAPGQAPVGVDACGAVAGAASPELYRDKGLAELPSHGPLAAITVASAPSGWLMAHELSRTRWGGRLPVQSEARKPVDPEVIKALRRAGLCGPFDEMMGHAGLSVRPPDGLIEGVTDPRSDGAVAGALLQGSGRG